MERTEPIYTRLEEIIKIIEGSQRDADRATPKICADALKLLRDYKTKVDLPKTTQAGGFKDPKRIALISRTGYGKTSLLSAFLNRLKREVKLLPPSSWRKNPREMGPQWEYFLDEEVCILNTQGYIDPTGVFSDDEIAEKTYTHGIMEEGYPELFVFLIKPPDNIKTFVDLAEGLKKLECRMKENYYFYVPIVVVITHCDELDPHVIKLHESYKENSSERDLKRQKVKRLEEKRQKEMERWAEWMGGATRIIGVMGVSAKDSEGKKEFWRIEELWKFLFTNNNDPYNPQESAISKARKFQYEEAAEWLAKKLSETVAMKFQRPHNSSESKECCLELIIIIGHFAGESFKKDEAGQFLQKMDITDEMFYLREQENFISHLGNAAVSYYILRKQLAVVKETFTLQLATLKLKDIQIRNSEVGSGSCTLQ